MMKLHSLAAGSGSSVLFVCDDETDAVIFFAEAPTVVPTGEEEVAGFVGVFDSFEEAFCIKPFFSCFS